MRSWWLAHHRPQSMAFYRNSLMLTLEPHPYVDKYIRPTKTVGTVLSVRLLYYLLLSVCLLY